MKIKIKCLESILVYVNCFLLPHCCCKAYIILFHDAGPYHLETNLLCKSKDWFLYDRDLRHERVNTILPASRVSYFHAFAS